MHAPDVPNPRDELIRKTVEFMVQLQERLDRQMIDPVVASVQCAAVWQVTAGLVDGETSELLSSQANLVGPRPVKRYFAGHGKVLLLAYLPAGDGYVLQQISTETAERKILKRSDSQVGEREQEIATLVDLLKTQGYTPI